MLKLLKDTIGNTLYTKRMEFDLSQEAMASKCCISTREYTDLENRKRLPQFRTFLNIAIICKIDLNNFLKVLVENGYKVTDENNAA